MKRKLCLILCIALLLPTMLSMAQAEEIEFCKIRIDSGAGISVEKAIIEEDELYISASSFGRYTRFNYHRESNTFLIAGQEETKAFKKIVINPENKKLAVGNQLIELKNCYIVDGEVYLPFCQMMPILNAEILGVENGVICVMNNALSMAELLYDFSITDYSYNLADEFYGDKGLLLAYVLPSYLFNSVVDFRFDRIGWFCDMGDFEDYRLIFRDYLRDDALFNKAFTEIDEARTILRLVTGLNDETKKLHDLVSWFRKIEDLELKEDSPLSKDILVRFIQTGEKYPRYQDDLVSVVTATHQDDYGISPADFMELVDYLYVCYNHVEDNQQMLDAVYGAATLEDVMDAQYRAAHEVYNMYGNGWKTVPALGDQVVKELLLQKAEDTLAPTKLKLYELTAKLGGEALELVIPGSTKDVSVLTLHAGVVNTAMLKASSGNLNTEESTENFRLSLLLMMLASRKCYSIMADVAEGYGYSAADYQRKIEKLENMIMGLYRVAENAAFDTYEHFGTFAEENRQMLKQGGIFDEREILAPGEVIGPGEHVYLDFLHQHPEYTHYYLLDINGDGCDELLATEDTGSPHSYVDLWVYNGSFILGWEDIWVKYANLTYSSENLWVEEILGGTGGGGVMFYYLDEDYQVQTESIEYYDFCGYLYNGEEVTDEALQEKWDKLSEKYHPETSTEIVFMPIYSEDKPVDEMEELFMHFLRAYPRYSRYAILDINQDGCPELLTSEIYEMDGVEKIDIWVYRDDVLTLSYSNICAAISQMTYNPEQCWLENVVMGAAGGGMEFFYLDETLNIQRTSFEYYYGIGDLHDGKTVTDREAFEALKERYDPEKSVDVQFMYISE